MEMQQLQRKIETQRIEKELGVYTAAPRIVDNAIKLENISYDEMLEFSNLGTGVLHND